MTTLRRMTTTTVAQGQLIRGGWHVPPLQTSAPKTVEQNQVLRGGCQVTTWVGGLQSTHITKGERPVSLCLQSPSGEVTPGVAQGQVICGV
jgi:hypothetical protein